MAQRSDNTQSGQPNYQTLYRRYRPQRFDEVLGQDHITVALRNSVRDGRVAHAYLFSGPRGTGKTSTARILAKALNCSNLTDGEPCGRCDSCVAIAAGSSLDVHEMDAASNNGVEAMRDLVARAALGTPGDWKVYIVDEVHMLSAAASNALLKTLEEPPSHVVFVLATTDPQKVLPTIRSRTHHFEFRLLGADVLSELLERVREDAGLSVGPDAVDAAVRKANGSARDALSVLDQVVALGSVEDEIAYLDDLVEALCDKDAGRALVAVAEASAAGKDAQRLATDLLEHLRQGFLATMAPSLVTLPDAERVIDQARRLGAAALVRAMEVLGTTLVEMRESLDTRVALEVALVRLTQPEADDSLASLAERVHRLERRQSAPGESASPRQPALADPRPSKPTDPVPSGPRAALGALRRPKGAEGGGAEEPPGSTGPQSGVQDATAPDVTPAASGPAAQLPSRDALVKAWGDHVLSGLSGRARALYRSGRFVDVEDGYAVFALPDETHRSYSEGQRTVVEQALAAHFGVVVPLRLVVEGEAPDPPGPSEQAGDDSAFDEVDFDRAGEPVSGIASVEERLMQVFPGAEEVSDP